MAFITQFFKNPLKTGSIAPSSKYLAKAIVSQAELSDKHVIVELGSGSGVFTKQIMEQKPSKSVLIVLELNPVFVTQTKEKCPEAFVYQASAKDLKKYLKRHQFETCDCVISGLPWAVFENNTQKEILREVHCALAPQGLFLTFAYLPGLILKNGKGFKRHLKSIFLSVKTSEITWLNLPPAIIYKVRKRT